MFRLLHVPVAPLRRHTAGALAVAWVLAGAAPALSAQEFRPEGIPSTSDLAVHLTQRVASGELYRSFGPLRISERNPLYHLFLTPVVRGADVLPRGHTWIQLGHAYSNIFELNGSPLLEQRFDLERLSSSVTVLHGLRPGLEVGVQLGLQHSWAGFLDPLIQGVHTTFGFPNADREKVPQNQYRVVLTGPEGAGPVYLDLPSGTALEAPRLLLGWRLLGGEDRPRALTLRTTWKLPVGDLPASTGRSDGAAMLSYRESWRRTHLHLTGGAVLLNPTPELEVLVRRAAALGSVGVEYRLTRGLSLLGQFSGSTRYTRAAGFAELDRAPVNFAVGGAGMWRGWEWQVSFVEDLPANSPSVDFTLDLQLSRRSGGER